MRISDWISDVCSSDLPSSDGHPAPFRCQMRRPCGEGVWTAEARILADAPGGRRSAPWGGAPAARGKVRSRRGPGPDLPVVVHAGDEESPGSAGQLRFEDRTSVVEGKSV